MIFGPPRTLVPLLWCSRCLVGWSPVESDRCWCCDGRGGRRSGLKLRQDPERVDVVIDDD